MNKKELTAVVLLFVLLLGWGFLQRQLAPPPAPPDTPDTADPAASREEAPASTPAEHGREEQGDLPAPSIGTPAVPATETPRPAADETPDAASSEPEQTVFLENEVARFAVSSKGGAITSVQLKHYPETQEEGSAPVVLDFGSPSALELRDIPGFSARHDFDLTAAADGRSVLCTRRSQNGLVFERRIQIEEEYQLEVTDTLRNDSSETIALPEHAVAVGPMSVIRSKAKTRGIAYLGVDTLAAHGGAKVNHWGRKELPALFGHRGSLLSCARPNTGAMPVDVAHRVQQPLSWLAAKNKFFVQILAPEEESADAEIAAARDPETSGFEISTVWGALRFKEKALTPGESFHRRMSYFAGPKKYAILKTQGRHQEDVMEFGWFAWLCKPLLTILNKIYHVIPNYGIAIILLTALVRLVFWPVTHKSTESMKKMQKLQPLVAEIRAKHKSNPQKMNQEVMALYKENKVNPMAGCLPMVIQIPVFIALFTVLRSAVELRFASFLWISDLSEPEGLLAGMIPVVGSLNILPLFMTATMVWQQRLTPTAGDPQQQKMMMFMPVVMLFIFYSMPSALVLYWSTSQCIAIVQLLLQRRKSKDENETTPAAPRPAAPRKITGKSKGKKSRS